MARGVDTGAHPGRQVGRDWVGHTSVSAPAYGVSTMRSFGMAPEFTKTVYKGGQGYHAEVEQYVPEGRGSFTNNNFVAGPFRTQTRAIGAAEGLQRRVQSGGDVSRYHRSSHYLTRHDFD